MQEFDLAILPDKFTILKADDLCDILQPLLLVILENGNFISFTKSEKELSLVVSANDFDKFFDSDKVYKLDYYIGLTFDTNGLIDQAGILSRLTRLFAEWNISILCISTFDYNYILLPENDFDKFTKMCRENECININIDNLKN